MRTTKGAACGLDPQYTEGFHCPQNKGGLLECSF